MNVNLTSSPKQPPVLAAVQLAMVHTDDFARLGATDMSVSDAGVALDFGSAQSAGVAKAALRDHVSVVAGDEQQVFEVSVQVAGAPSQPVGITDVVTGLQQLRGVSAVEALVASKCLTVHTPDMADAERLNQILRRSILGYDVVYTNGEPSVPAKGWGSGIG